MGVEMLDLSGVANYQEAVRDHVKQTEATCFGLTATTPQMPAASKINHLIRENQRGRGSYWAARTATLVHAARRSEIKNNVVGRGHQAVRQLEEMFDVLVAGDGEEAVFLAAWRSIRPSMWTGTIRSRPCF